MVLTRKNRFFGGFLDQQFFEGENIVIGGNPNFTFSRAQIWGLNASLEKEVAYFKYKLEEAKLVEVEPLKLVPT